ncbi:hypothetical protein [Spirosoma flavus]
MKPKTDETPDEWIRQTLSQLPDTPPPGSSFDSERLWTQLRPELQQTPVRRRIGWVWWTAAACLLGLVWSWFAWNQPVSNQKQVATYQRIRQANMPFVSLPKDKVIAKTTTAAPVTTIKSQLKTIRYHTGNQKHNSTERNVAPMAEPVETVATLPAPATFVNVAPVAEKSPEQRKTNIASGTSKRRFRVVHENELRAEEEAAPQLYHIDNFVRLGAGQRESNVSDSRQPTLIMPLTTKSNQ